MLTLTSTSQPSLDSEFEAQTTEGKFLYVRWRFGQLKALLYPNQTGYELGNVYPQTLLTKKVKSDIKMHEVLDILKKERVAA